MPTPKADRRLARTGAADFRFTLKAPKRITHDKRLRAAEVVESVNGFMTAASELGPQLAALLFQLPPNFKKDLGLLKEFLALAAAEDDGGVRVPERVLAGRRSVRRAAGQESGAVHRDSETRETPIVTTADYAYLRLRDEGIWRRGDRAVDRHREELGETAKDVFVYFKHEDEGKGAAFGQQMMNLLEKSS
jgi:uncharacterized protein YecE (DUF72 family)